MEVLAHIAGIGKREQGCGYRNAVSLDPSNVFSDRFHAGHRYIDGVQHVVCHRIESHEDAAIELPAAEHRVRLRALCRLQYAALHLDALAILCEHVITLHRIGQQVRAVGISHQPLRKVTGGRVAGSDDAPFEQDRQRGRV